MGHSTCTEALRNKMTDIYVTGVAVLDDVVILTTKKEMNTIIAPTKSPLANTKLTIKAPPKTAYLAPSCLKYERTSLNYSKELIKEINQCGSRSTVAMPTQFHCLATTPRLFDLEVGYILGRMGKQVYVAGTHDGYSNNTQTMFSLDDSNLISRVTSLLQLI